MQPALQNNAVSKHLKGKRIVLASASPRRKEILEECLGWTGFEVIPSTFDETLPHADYVGREEEYPVDTAAEKALQVYENEVRNNLENPPDLVISADTIILLPADSPGDSAQILEKPGSKATNLSMLEKQNGRKLKCITGVNIVYPSLHNPGYAIRSMLAETEIEFADCPQELLASYAENGEGVDRAGGWAIQGYGSLLIKSIKGDYGNVKGFPAHAFYAFLQRLIDDEEYPGDE